MKNTKGMCPLHIACKENQYEAAEILLRHGAKVNSCNAHGSSPLYVACKKGHTKVVRLLLNYGADVNKSSTRGFTPLYISCPKKHNDYFDIVDELLKKDADVNQCDKYGISPQDGACWNGNKRKVKRLLHNR